MHEFISKNSRRFLASIGALLLSVSTFLMPVYADNQSDIMYIFNNPNLYSKSYLEGYYWRIRFGTSNTNSLVTPLSVVDDPNTIYMLKYRLYNGEWHTLFYTYLNDGLLNQNGNTVRLDRTSDRINFTNRAYINLNQQYTYNNGSTTGKRVIYSDLTDESNTSYNVGGLFNNYNCPDEVPRILLKQNQNNYSILGIISSEDFRYLPWNGTTSSGGVYFDDGTTLDPENSSKYTQIYNVMDVNQDNSVSIAEVNYYNQTYNTDYDYSSINNDNDFTAMEFLYWVATQINDGNDNPGGGTGSGGGSSAVGGGISVVDSFTQSQTQNIESNAVNVTVTNNNELTQENLNEINNIINNNTENETTFQDAVSNMNQFRAMAIAFAGLAGVVLGWLPSWVVGLLSLMFSILSIMIVIRLIHLFV